MKEMHLYYNAEGQPFRLGNDVVQLLDLIADNSGLASDHARIATLLGVPWTESLVSRTLVSIQRAGIALDQGAPSLEKHRRVKFVGIHALQLTLLDPTRAMPRLEHVGKVFAGRVSTGIQIVTGICGLLSLFLAAGSVDTALRNGITPSGLAISFALVLASTVIHEFAHAWTLMAYGGKPRRMGIMIFYFWPAMFCDVTALWTLKSHLQRVHVALAGVLINFFLAGLSLVAVLTLSLGAGADSILTLFAISSYAIAFLNLVPFIKLDGYIALAAYLDKPFLRARSMALVDDTLRLRRTDTTQYASQMTQLQSVPASLYGLACMLTPWVLAFTLLASITPIYQASRALSLVVYMVVGAALIYRIIARVFTNLKLLKARSLSVMGACTSTAFTLAMVGGVLFMVPLPILVSGGVQHNGSITLISSAPLPQDMTNQRTIIPLYRVGLVSKRTRYVATPLGPSIRCKGAIHDILPALNSNLRRDAWCTQVSSNALHDSTVNGFRLRVWPRGLVEWLTLTNQSGR